MPADTQEGDIVLIATAGTSHQHSRPSCVSHPLLLPPGAYGHSMASNYNLRDPATEHFLPS
jgi:diaminopimelate decarboxylase